MIGATLALALSIEDDGISLHKDPFGSYDDSSREQQFKSLIMW